MLLQKAPESLPDQLIDMFRNFPGFAWANFWAELGWFGLGWVPWVRVWAGLGWFEKFC